MQNTTNTDDYKVNCTSHEIKLLSNENALTQDENFVILNIGSALTSSIKPNDAKPKFIIIDQLE
jgi:hypothetical protein